MLNNMTKNQAVELRKQMVCDESRALIDQEIDSYTQSRQSPSFIALMTRLFALRNLDRIAASKDAATRDTIFEAVANDWSRPANAVHDEQRAATKLEAMLM